MNKFKWLEGLAWFFIALAALILILGLIGICLGGPLLFTSRGCSVLSISFLLFALNFSLIRSIKLREEAK